MRPLRALPAFGNFTPMSDTTTTDTGLGEQPAIDADATAQETSAQPEPGAIHDTFNSLSDAEKAAILFPEEEIEDDGYDLQDTEEPENEVTETAATEEEAVSETPTEEATASQPAKAPKRVSVRALPDDQQVLVARAVEMVRNGEAPDILTATAMLGGSRQEAQATTTQEAATETATETATEANSETTTPSDPIASIQDRLKTLREEREQAILDYDGSKQAELTNQIEDTLAELSDAKAVARLEAREAETQAKSFQQNWQTAVEQIEAAYPDLQDDDSAFSRVFDGMVASERNRNPQAFSDPAELRELADEVAGILKAQPTRATTAQPRTPLPAQPRPTSPNGSAVAPGHTQATRITADDARRFIRTASQEQLDALVDELG